MKTLIVIEGPTASGKTALSVELALHYNSVVLSSDSRQFYKELSIGTAKPTEEEQKGVPHYFIDSHNLSDELSAGEYESEGLQLLSREFKTHDTIILTGGSGMFTDALCYGLDELPVSEELKARLIDRFNVEGLQSLLDELKELDPDFYNRVDQKNPSRVIRALEVCILTGKPFSELRTGNKKERPFRIARFVIDIPREILYDRINRRVDLMIKSGLVEEAHRVLPLKDLRSLQTVGYKELFDYFEGKSDLESAIELIKQHTRNYAKRQLTFFRRHPESIWIHFDTPDKMKEEVIAKISDLTKME